MFDLLQFFGHYEKKRQNTGRLQVLKCHYEEKYHSANFKVKHHFRANNHGVFVLKYLVVFLRYSLTNYDCM